MIFLLFTNERTRNFFHYIYYIFSLYTFFIFNCKGGEILNKRLNNYKQLQEKINKISSTIFLLFTNERTKNFFIIFIIYFHYYIHFSFLIAREEKF